MNPSSKKVAEYRRRLKKDLVEKLGGECLICGYKRYQGALHFHHKSRSEKSFGISGSGITRSKSKTFEEVKKCVLLCANCHAEVEAGVTII